MSRISQPRGERDSRLNVLLLDGGGVRGLSSLLLLQELMLCINTCIKRKAPETPELQPQDIFDLVAGTSTGGLIALMLGKMGMTVADCIQQYEDLSKQIFGKTHLRASLTMRLGHAKYSGKRLQKSVSDLLKQRHLAEDHMMGHNDGVHDRIPCAVVCREHLSPSRYAGLKKKAVCICSLDCGEESVVCRVCDAARATSAAPTYFPVAKIEARGGQRYFSDGGFENNNPTISIINHYETYKRAKSAAPYNDTPQVARHGSLDFTRVRYVNIGTGTMTDALARHRDTVASLLPGFIRMGIFLKETLTEIAASAERDAAWVRMLADRDPINLKYERFSADTGVCFIKLYHYKRLPQIKELTEKYLETEKVRIEMRRVASELAEGYLDSHMAERNSVEQLTEEPAEPATQKLNVDATIKPPYLKTMESESTREETPRLTPQSSGLKNEGMTGTPSTTKSLHESDMQSVSPPAMGLMTASPAATSPKSTVSTDCASTNHEYFSHERARCD